jgi:hypothetical protein
MNRTHETDDRNASASERKPWSAPGLKVLPARVTQSGILQGSEAESKKMAKS